MTRRQLLRLIGLSAGSATMYQAMASLGLAEESPFTGTPQLGAAPPGASVAFHRDGGFVVARVGGRSPLLPGVLIAAEAVAAVEPGQ